jgi:D-inositol-3-phosphate glycosyltransferase
VSRILWISDGGVTTGFGTVTHNIGDRLVDLGHDVHVLAANHTGDYFPTKVKLYKANTKEARDTVGKTRVVEMLAEVMPDVVVLLNDPHTLTNLLFNNEYDTPKALLRFRPLIAYLPIDGANLPPVWSEMTKFVKPVPMSNFGARQLKIDDRNTIYHGVDEIFRPASKDDPLTMSNGAVITSKAEAKEAFGFKPDDFLIGRVDRNSWRKDFAGTWKAIVPVMKRHDNVQAYFHCQRNDPAGGPILPGLFTRDMDTIDRFELPRKETFNTYRGWPTIDLVGIMNAFDIFVTTSMGEGFGLTIAEAMACEVPVVAQDCSAISEVVGSGGILIEPGAAVTSPMGVDLRVANVEAFTDAIDELYQNAGLRRDLGRRARRRVLKHFRWGDKALAFDRIITAIHQASLTQGTDPQQAVEEAAASV